MKLKKNEGINHIVDSILSDKSFKDNCKEQFEKIFEDGVVDQSDIPLIINLFLTIYSNHNKVKVSKKQLKDVFILLISKLLLEFKGECDLNEELILILIEPQIDLLLMTIPNNCKFPCCSSRPSNDNTESLVQQQKKQKTTINKTKLIEYEPFLPLEKEVLVKNIEEEVLVKNIEEEVLVKNIDDKEAIKSIEVKSIEVSVITNAIDSP